MKTLLIIGSVFGLLAFNWSSIHSLLTATPDFTARHKEDVVLYATNWCSNCAQTRQFLASNNIPYFEYNIETSSEGQKQYKQLHGNGVPVILVKDQIIRGYNPVAIQKAVTVVNETKQAARH